MKLKVKSYWNEIAKIIVIEFMTKKLHIIKSLNWINKQKIRILSLFLHVWVSVSLSLWISHYNTKYFVPYSCIKVQIYCLWLPLMCSSLREKNMQSLDKFSMVSNRFFVLQHFCWIRIWHYFYWILLSPHQMAYMHRCLMKYYTKTIISFDCSLVTNITSLN